MDNRKHLQANSVTNAADLLRELVAKYPALTEIARYSKRLTTSVATIRKLAGDQATGKIQLPSSPAIARTARKRVRKMLLIPIARRGRPFFRDEPAILRVLKLPHAHSSLEAHADAAVAIAKALTPYAKACREEGFPTNFIRDLKAAAKELRTKAKVGDEARRLTSTSGHGLRQAIRQARQDVSTVHALLEAEEVERDEDTVFRGFMVRWRNASRVGKRLGRPPKRRGPKPPIDGSAD